jgi:hypothetical protein
LEKKKSYIPGKQLAYRLRDGEGTESTFTYQYVLSFVSFRLLTGDGVDDEDSEEASDKNESDESSESDESDTSSDDDNNVNKGKRKRKEKKSKKKSKKRSKKELKKEKKAAKRGRKDIEAMRMTEAGHRSAHRPKADDVDMVNNSKKGK